MGLSIQKQLKPDEVGAAFYGGMQGNASGLDAENNSAVHGGAEMRSDAKRKLIKMIAREFARRLRIAGLASIVDNDDIDAIVEKLREHVPNPSKSGNKKTWAPSRQSQVQACRTLAEIINENMGHTIDVDTEPAALCMHTAEVVYALTSSLSSELAVARRDIKNNLKNIELLREMLKKTFAHMLQRMQAADLDTDVNTARAAHEEILGELDRQVQILQALLDSVVQPSTQDLEELQREATGLRSMVKRLRRDPGSSEFGKKFAYTLSGFTVAADVARVVDKSLQQLNISLDEFKSAKSLQKIEDMLSARAMQVLGADSDAVAAYVRAREMLLSNHYMHDEIVQELEKLKKSKSKKTGGSDTLDKRVRKRKQLRAALVNDFETQMNKLINQVLQSSKHIAHAMTSNDVNMDKMRLFIDALRMLPSLHERRVWYSLSSAYVSAEARQEREQFQKAVRAIVRALDDLLKDTLPGKQHFADMRNTMKLVDALIENYTRNLNQKLTLPTEGGAEGGSIGSVVKQGAKAARKAGPKIGKAIKKSGKVVMDSLQTASDALATAQQSVDMANQLALSVRDARAQLRGFDLEDRNPDNTVVGAAETAETTRMANDLQETVNTITYYFNVGKMRKSLQRAASEINEYGEGYDKILGDAIAKGIDAVARDRREFRETCSEDTPEGKKNCRALTSDIDDGDRDKKTQRIERILTFADEMFDAKSNMYRTAEAVDIYMKAFADGIARNPNDVQSVMSMLKNTETISQWFTARSGDNVAHVFEAFPALYDNGEAKYSNIKQNDSDAHYYLRMAATTGIARVSKLTTDQQGKVKTDGAGNLATDPRSDKIDARANGSGFADRVVGLPGNPFQPTRVALNDDDKHTGIAALADAKKAAGYGALKNLVAAFITMGERFGGKTLISQTHMSPKLILRSLQNYIAASSFHFASSSPLDLKKYAPELENYEYTDTAGNNKDTQDLLNFTEHLSSGEVQEFANRVASDARERAFRQLIANEMNKAASGAAPPLSFTDDDVVNADTSTKRREILKADKFDLIKNIETVAHQLTVSMYPLEIKRVTVNPPTATNIAAAVPAAQNATREFVLDLIADADAAVGLISSTIVEYDTAYKVDTIVNHISAASPINVQRAVRPEIGVSRRTDGSFCNYVVMRGVYPELEKFYPNMEDMFCETDKLFQLVLKAMVAKILTVVGTYSALNHPIQKSALGYKSSLRLVLGGDAGTPKVVPEAFELYVRLPLLAEFYRHVFDFDERKTKITMIPEIEGVFSGIVELIFDKSRAVKDGNYSDGEVRTIVEQVNRIYAAYREHKSPVDAAISGFVNEVNRRYGIINSKDKAEYLRERDERYKFKYQEPEEITDFEIRGIEESDTYRQPAPSDGYRNVAGTAGKAREHKHSIDWSQKMMLDDLRRKMDNLFENAEKSIDVQGTENPQERLRTISFAHMIRARQEELRITITDEERFNVVRTAITSLGSFAMNILERNYIAFHETVVASLNTLYATYNALDNMRQRANVMHYTLSKVEEVAGWNPETKAYTTGGAVADIPQNAYTAQYALTAGQQGTSANVNPVNAATIVPGGNVNTETNAELVHRFAINQERMFVEYHEMLFTHESLEDILKINVQSSATSDKVENGEFIAGERQLSISLDTSSLRERVYSLMRAVKNQLERFRGLLPNQVIAKYENLKFNGSDNIGSVYDLEKKLIDGLLEGRQQGVEPFDNINKQVQHIADYFTHAWNVSGNLLVAANANNIADLEGVGARLRVKRVHHEFSQSSLALLYRNPITVFNYSETALPNALPTNIANDTLIQVLYNTTGKTIEGKAANDKFDGVGRYFNVLHSPNGDFHNNNTAHGRERSIVVLFNRLLASYLANIYDDTSKVVYKASLEQFVSAFSSSINGNDNLKRLNLDQGIHSITSEGRGVIAETLAKIIGRLMTQRKANASDLEYATSEVSELPAYLQERMRANLPVVMRMLNMLSKKCEFLKSMAKAVNLRKEYDTLRGDGNLIPLPPGLGAAAVPGALPADATKYKDDVLTQRFESVLEGITRGCFSIIQSARRTLEDIGDSPLYLQTYDNFISDYENMYNREPFMPLSSTLKYLTNFADTEHPALPNHRPGNNKFKFMYGTRGLLKDKPELIAAPGVRAIIRAHNESSEPRHAISDDSAQAIFRDQVSLLKYLVNMNLYKSMLVLVDSTGPEQYYRLNTRDAAAPASFDTVNLLRGLETCVYQAKTNVSIDDALRITESSSQQEQRNNIVQHVESVDDNKIVRGNRNNLIAYNIIDLNIVPINVHALMREIPLVNLYNYGYTFDRMVGNMLNCSDYASKFDPENPNHELQYSDVNTAECLLALLTIEPYYQIDKRTYQHLLSRVMRGALGVQGLGRPKYLSDEIWNKPLFGENIADRTFDDEMGPAGAHQLQSGSLGRGAVMSLVEDFIYEVEAAPSSQFKEVIWNSLGEALKNKSARALTSTSVLRVINAELNRNAMPLLRPNVRGVSMITIINNILTKAEKMYSESVGGEFRNNKSSLLHYMEDKDGKYDIQSVDVQEFKSLLQAWGKMRFDSRLVRNLFWISNLQRILRVCLRRELHWYNSKVVSEHAILADGLTELYDQDAHQNPNMTNYKY